MSVRRSRITIVETDYTPDESVPPLNPPTWSRKIPYTGPASDWSGEKTTFEEEAEEDLPLISLPYSSRKFTIAPIAGNPKADSYKNYATMTAGSSWKWSDEEKNGSCAGDYFAFFFTENKLRPNEEQIVVIHKITGIRKQVLVMDARGVLYGCDHGDWEVPILDDRMTLILSEPLKKYTLDEWKSRGGGMKIQGTYRTDMLPNNIFA